MSLRNIAINVTRITHMLWLQSNECSNKSQNCTDPASALCFVVFITFIYVAIYTLRYPLQSSGFLSNIQM